VGKIDPDRLPDAVVCYLDSTVALPLLTSYAHARHARRRFAPLRPRAEMIFFESFNQGVQEVERVIERLFREAQK